MVKEFKIKKGLISQKMGKETIIFDGEKSLLFTLNDIGAYIFQKIKARWTEEKIATALAKRYAIKTEKAKKDISTFVKKLSKWQIVSKTSLPSK